MNSTTSRAGLAMLCWFCKKNRIVQNLKALQLELIFCSARGTLEKEQVIRAKKKARSLVYSLHHYKRRCNLSMNHSVTLN